MALVFMSIVPPAMFSLYVVFELAQSREELLSNELLSRGTATVATVGQELQQVVTVLEVLARSDRLRSGQMAAFHAEALRILSVAPELRSIGLIGVDGRQILNTRIPYGQSVPDSNAPEVAAKVFAVGRPILGRPFVGATSQELSIAIGVPVKSEGAVVYCLKASLRIGVFSDLIQRQQIPADWTASVVDGMGTIVARSRAPESFVGTPATDRLRQALAEGQRGLIDSVTREGTVVRAAVIEIPGWDWLVAIGAPRASLFEPLYRWLWAIAVVGVGALIGAMLWALWLSGLIANRVHQAYSASRALQDGRTPDLQKSYIRELDEMVDALAVAGRLQEKLRTSEEELRLLADSTSDMIGRLDLEGRYLYVSAAVSRLYGFTESELIGRLAKDFVHPEDLDRVSEALDRVRRGIQPVTVRFRRRHRNGYYVWIETAISAVAGPDGTPAEIVIASRDITAQQQAAERLREDDGRHRAVMESAADAILLTDDDGRYVDANPVALAMTGYSIEELRHLGIADLVAERDRHRLPEHIEATLRGERRLMDWWMRRKNGSEFLAEFSTLRLPDGRLLAVGRDVSARREAEARLQLAASVFTETNEGIMITDADSNILDVNPAFCELTGYRRDEVLGRNPRFLQSGYHEHDFYAGMWTAIKQKGRWQGELWNRSSDGGVHPQQVTISAIRDNTGAVVRFLGVFADISERKREQEKVEHLAYHDALTKLPNRLLLGDRLERALARATRSDNLVVIGYLDLDGFKQVNDAYGHKAGDAVLRHVARCFDQGMRGHDTAARIGGDEFVLVISEVRTRDEWEPVITRVVAAIAELCDIGEGHMVSVTTSVGVATFPTDGTDPETLLQRADLALYRAKRSGRNRICLYAEGEQAGGA